MYKNPLHNAINEQLEKYETYKQEHADEPLLDHWASESLLIFKAWKNDAKALTQAATLIEANLPEDKATEILEHLAQWVRGNVII